MTYYIIIRTYTYIYIYIYICTYICHATNCRAVACHVMLCCVMLWHVMSVYASSYHFTSISYHSTSCHTMLCPVASSNYQPYCGCVLRCMLLVTRHFAHVTSYLLAMYTLHHTITVCLYVLSYCVMLCHRMSRSTVLNHSADAVRPRITTLHITV